MKCPKCNNDSTCEGWDIATIYNCNSCDIVVKIIRGKLSIFVCNQKFEDETIRFVDGKLSFNKEKFYKFVDNIIFA